MILSADQITAGQHEADARSLLQQLTAVERFFRHPRKEQSEQYTECKDEKGLERIHDKHQCDGRQERRVERDSFAEAE